MMTKGLVIRNFGGPEELVWTETPIDEPRSGEVKLAHRAIGMNMMEIGLRTGVYPGPPLPFIPGVEAASEIIAIGENVTDYEIGDRVGYAGPPVGSYCEERIYPSERLFPIPDDIDDDLAAASMVKGITARCLMQRTHPVQKGTRVLIHAAAGATGLMCLQLAKALGAEVFGTVSSSEKAELIESFGCDHSILYSETNFADAVLEITDGIGVDVCYDSIGSSTFSDSIRCTHYLGTVALFGVASGLPEPVPLMLQDLNTAQKFVRPSIYAYTKARGDLLNIAEEMFNDLRVGNMKPHIHAKIPLQEAAAAHREVESRKTMGSLIFEV